MNRDKQFELMIKQYYSAIFKYCYVKLKKDREAAKDCTQEVFLLFTRKKDELELDHSIKSWLYRSADIIIHAYLRQSVKHNHVDLDEVSISCDGGLASFIDDSPMDALREILAEDDYQLLLDYYTADYGHRNEVADKHNMSLAELYHKIVWIKKKIIG